MISNLHPVFQQALAPFMAARFPATSCSQCGSGFGPGDHGFSHCQDHADPRDSLLLEDADEGEDGTENDAENEGGICPTCSGSGEGRYEGSDCYACKGRGKI